jgi:hypothetical protein
LFLFVVVDAMDIERSTQGRTCYYGVGDCQSL